MVLVFFVHSEFLKLYYLHLQYHLSNSSICFYVLPHNLHVLDFCILLLHGVHIIVIII
jgi:hypothetical protein